MRPHRFSPLAPSRSLTIAHGAISGLNQGLQDLAKLRMQKAQMEAHKMNAEAMKVWRTSQAQYNEQRSAGVNTAKVHAAYLMDKFGITDGMTEKAISEMLIKNKDATPADVRSITAWAHQRSQDGLPMMPGLNMNEAKAFAQEGRDTTKVQVAGIQGEHGDYRANVYGKTRLGVADRGYQGKVDAAKIYASRPTSGHSPGTQALKDSNARLLQYQKSLDLLDKPTPMGAAPMDDGLKKTIRDRLENKLLEEHENYQKLLHGGSDQGQPMGGQGGGQTQPPAGPKVFSWDQRTQAPPGTYVQHPNGKLIQSTGNGHALADPQNPKMPKFIDPAQLQGGAPQAPPSAPAAPPAAPGANYGPQPPPFAGGGPGAPGMPPVPTGMESSGTIPGME